MSVSLTTLTGPIFMPDGATPVGGRVSFELSSWDREEGEALFISGPVYSTIDENGEFSVQLFTTTVGENTVNYKMYVIWEDSSFSQSYINNVYISAPTPHYTKKYIGSFALSGSGPFKVSDLNIMSELELNSFDVLLECQAYALAAEASKEEATAQAVISTTQAGILTTQAGNAQASAIEAATSESNASTSATAAAGSAATASAAASAASTSAGNAAGSASSASTSASTATTKADIATTQAGNATASYVSTQGIYDQFNNTYLGDKSANPALDNDGNPLLTGALYFNTTLAEMRVYTGAAWVAAYASLGSVLLKTNGLADLLDPSKGLANLHGYATTAKSGGTTTLTAASAVYQRFTGSSAHSVVLPDAGTLQLGSFYDVHNNNAPGTLTVKSADASTIVAALPGQVIRLVCVLASGATAGSWGVTLLGTDVLGNAAILASTNTTGIPSGRYLITAATAGVFPVDWLPANGGIIDILRGDAGAVVQLLYCGLTGRSATRHLVGGLWQPWREAITVDQSPVAGDMMYFDGSNFLRLAKGTAGQALTMNAGATAPEWRNGIDASIVRPWKPLVTQATTSGTAFSWALPSDATEIELYFSEVSLTGTDFPMVQLGTGGTYPTGIYKSVGFSHATGTDSGFMSGTNSFVIMLNAAAEAFAGRMSIGLVDGVWWSDHHMRRGITGAGVGYGNVTLGGPIDAIRLTRAGSNTFDLGSITGRYR